MSRSLVRHHLVALVTFVAGVLLLSSVPAVAAPPTVNRAGNHADNRADNRADAAAGWLARQMVDGERFEVDFGGEIFPDQGLTIDAIFAFATAKVADAYAVRATAWLARPDILSGYIGDGTVESYAGSTAKLALAIQVRGGNPAAFGGVDLITRLRGLQQPSGRFSDRSAFGDFSNGFSQAFAILALDRTAAGAPAPASAFLAASRCPDGGYPLLFAQASCVSEVDATAMAVQALLAAGRYADANAGLQWLVSVQGADGGFPDTVGTPNANSTGLAGQALRAGGRLNAAKQANLFLIGLQVGCAGPVADRGAIAFSAAGFDPATAPRATAQAMLGMAGSGFAHLHARGAKPHAPLLACS